MDVKKNTAKVTKEEALDFHRQEKKGKLSVSLNKSLRSAKDLSLAYSPGVGFPCLEIQRDIDLAYEYTSKGNFIAVITNGTAVLGFGAIGALAGKPVMEGKSALMKRFADVDSIDIEVKTTKIDEFVFVVQNIGDTWGGINLEDIKAPECFEIEQKLQETMSIPIFHDDQHGTAIVTLAAIINAAKIGNKDTKKLKYVFNGAGAAGIASAALLVAFGIPKENIIICDTEGVIYKGRKTRMNEWKKSYANDTTKRTLAEAVVDADVLIGLSAKGAFTPEMIKSMAPNPVIFAMANPDPEMLPEEIIKIRNDAIIATGRSDYPNQVNNVLCFPYLFRGALDVRAEKINKEMQLAAAIAIASIAQEPIEENVRNAYGKNLVFGREYIVPTSFDSRLMVNVSSAVAEAAMKTGVARKPIQNIEEYKKSLKLRIK